MEIGLMICMIILLILFTIFIGIIFIGIVAYIKTNNKNNQSLEGTSFSDLMDILKGIIAIEIDLYETNIFKDREGITNSNFDNFYKDMCESIEKNISEEFMNEITKYVTIDFVYTLIARKIKVYLTSKVV